MTINIIQYDKVSVYIGSKKIISDASCSIPKNSLTFLVGENGSGKTTLVKSILGLLPLSSGQISFDVIQNRKPILGYVPQNIVFPEPFKITVSENLK